VLEIIEILILLILHPIEIRVPESKENVEVLYIVFAALLALTFLISLLVAGKHLHSEEERKRKEAERRLEPDLEICADVPTSTGKHQRIKVRNRSSVTIRFSVKLTSLVPGLPHYDKIPNFLQIDDSDHPHHKESLVEGGGCALVNVLACVGRNQQGPLYALQIASPGIIPPMPVMGGGFVVSTAGDIAIPNDHYRIRVQTFPVDSGGVVSEPRDFYITPQPGGTLLLHDAGKPFTKPPRTPETS
jgi:hypothetical protein